MNAFAGILFVLGGDGIMLISVLSENSGSFGTTISAFFGILAICIGLYYMLCYINKRVTVSDDGVIYSNWTGRKSHYDWDQVSVSHHLGRNAFFIFNLAGKRVKFYGYSRNAQALFDYLMEHDRFDGDTVRAYEKAQEKQAERVRLMQKDARVDESEWDED